MELRRRRVADPGRPSRRPPVRSRSTPSTRIRILRAARSHAGIITRATGLFDRPPLARATTRHLADRRNVVYLAMDGGRPVGFVRGTALPQLDTAKLQMFLYEIALARPYRRRGVGHALVRRLLRDCWARGFAEVFVLTSPYNRPAVRLYRTDGGRTETRADRMFVFNPPETGDPNVI